MTNDKTPPQVAEVALRDLPIAVSKTAAMRYLAEQAGHGYVFFQQGIVPGEKAVALFEKFDRLYNVLATRGAREHAKVKGRSRARLVMYPCDKPEEGFHFWLLSTQGEGALIAAANTRDARFPVSRLTWGAQYELVGRPVNGRKGLRHVWTWVMAEVTFKGWQERLQSAAGRATPSAGGNLEPLRIRLQMLRKVGGFQGINRQKLQLVQALNVSKATFDELHMKNLGSVVDKSLPVFSETVTLRTAVRAQRA